MSLEEAILDKIRSLPRTKQEEVLRFADRLQQESPVRIVPSRDRSREMDWIRENRATYADQNRRQRRVSPTVGSSLILKESSTVRVTPAKIIVLVED